MRLISNKSKCRPFGTRRIFESKFEDELRRINNRRPMKSWAEVDAEKGMTPEEGKRLRMQPGNAARAKAEPKSNKPYRLHTYINWRDEFKPKGISYDEYLEINLDNYYGD